MSNKNTNKSILVTGANGQLGNAVRKLASGWEHCVFYFTDIDTLDLCNKGQIHDFLKSNPVEYILNCASYTAVEKAEEDREICMSINRDAVQNIGEIASVQGIKVIHISTDYVFDGNASHPYCENDRTNPLSVYGESKLAGENALLAVCPDSVIIRTAWLYSEFGNNFVKTMLRLGNERETISVVSDQTGSPTYAGDLAMAILTIVNHTSFVPGIYHYTNEGTCSWYDFAVKIMTLAGLKCLVQPVRTTEYPTRAIRPAYSVLNKAKIRQVYGVSVPDWPTSLEVCLQNIQHSFAPQ
ncbi:MAG: dTDP-4-dehydrorhamnose reductase [Tannerella sp.]|jgi:dTDP-4-dehydrorhamnose reductase|nr:dTDP-4-dehydrorhamnose reductase [Tannerella sp.]